MPRTVNVVVEPGRLDIAPGGTAQLRVRIVNKTPVVDQFVVQVLGLDQRMTPQPQRVGLFPDQEGTVTFDLTVPGEQPPPAGPRVLAVRTTSQDDPRLSRVEEFTLTIGPLTAASIRVQPPRIKGGRTGRFAVVVSNEGNVPMQVALRGEDEAEEVSFAFDPPVVELPPGATVEAGGRARAPRPFSGPETTRPITVLGEGAPVALAARATLAQRSVVGSRLLRFAAVLALLGLILGIFLATRKNGPTTGAVAGPSDSPTASSTPSPTPSPTPSAGNGEGPVPDVSGQTADNAAGMLTQAGFTTDKVLAHSNTIAPDSVIRTDPTPGKTSADKKVTLFVSDGPTPPFDMEEGAPQAVWSNDDEGLQFNGNEGDPRGYARYRKNVTLENGAKLQRGLQMVPQTQPDGAIQGDYTLPSPIIEGDHFIADVGFETGHDGEVDVKVLVLDNQGLNPQEVTTVHDTGADGQLRHIDVDLSRFAGATILRLRVEAAGDPSNDWLIWNDPKVTGKSNG